MTTLTTPTNGRAAAPANEGRPSAAALTGRLARLREQLAAANLDAFPVSSPYNRRYLSGFTGHDAPPLDTAGMLIVTPTRVILVTDARYDLQAGQEMQGVEIVPRQGKTKDELIAQFKALASQRI